MLFRTSVLIHSTLDALATGVADRARRDDAGQATAEYALVLCGAAAVAVLLITWAAKSGTISDLFEKVVSQVSGKVQ